MEEEEEIPYDVAKKFSGYLEKKSKGLITKWQKRYFHILEGKIMVYAEKPEDIEIKGLFILDQISNPQSVADREFKFILEGRDFIFRTETSQLKDKWIKIITLLKQKLKESKSIKDNMRKSLRRDSSNTINSLNNKKEKEKDPNHNPKSSKKNKLAAAGKVTADIIRRNGFVTNKEQKVSSNLLKSKGITKLINVKDPKISNRIYYGFIYKKHKVQNYFQKRWFFIFSSRPLFDNYYIEDEIDLESKKQKDWMKFDNLFYFKYEDKDATSESQGSLDLVKSHKIELIDKDEKFYLYLDVEDRKFELYCDSKAERDIWFEVLKNARRTAKEYQASFTKHPRNVELLYSYFLLGEKDFTKKIEKEKTAIIGNSEEVEDFDIFEFSQNNLEYSIESTIDGCNSINPPKKDLLKAYSEYMNKEYLNIVKNFWDRKYKDFEHGNIIKLSMMLFIFGEKLFDLNVNDQNFSKNGKELAKIYLKKTYQNVLSVIENILRKEREVKAIVHDMGFYFTQGPNDLFEILSQTFDLLKNNRNKVIYEMTIDLFNSSINQYLLGVETVLNNPDIIMEKEFLLSVANNSLNMIQLMNSLIRSIKEMEVLTEKEINELIKVRSIMLRINRISQKSIIKFVFNFLNDLGNHFKIKSFLDLDTTKILISTNEIFGPYRQFMNSLVLKKSWNEILKMTLYHYIHLLITSTYNKVTVDQLKAKIKSDYSMISETYEGLVGKNLTEATIRILTDIHDFFDVSPYMISSSCLTLRQYIGPSFNLAKAKALIKLRTDFQEEDMTDGIAQCKEVLDNYQEEKKDEQDVVNYFQLIELEMKRREEEEKRIQREKEREKLKEMKKNEKLNKKMKKAKVGDGAEEEEEEEKEEEEEPEEEEKEDDIVQFNLDDFLDGDEEQEEKEDENPEKFAMEEEDKDVEQEEISDITYEGYMQKKSHSTWQKRYFQIKGGYLYWFKDKSSSVVQNKISIKNTLRVDSHKEKKFMMIVKESDEDLNKSTDEKDKKKAGDAGGKIYKFSCQTDEEKREWVTAITNEMKRLKKIGEEKTNIQNKLEIPVRNKIITDYFNLPDFNKDQKYMKKKVLEEMNNENFFQPSLRKIEALRKKAKREEKERKRKEKEEAERKKQQEKEERERKKREEKEEKIRKNNEIKAEKLKKKMEENKKIEEDLKSGKKVGIKNRLKFWFRTNVEGIKKEDQQQGIGEGNNNIMNFLNNNGGDEEDNNKNEIQTNNNNEQATNEIKMDDFLLDDDEDEKDNNENKINENNNTDINTNSENNNINNDNKINEIKISEENNIINNNNEQINITQTQNQNPPIVSQEKNININTNNNNNNIINPEKANNNNINNNVVNNANANTKNEQPSKMKSWFKNAFNFGGNKNKPQNEPKVEPKNEIKNEVIVPEKTEEEKAKEAEAERERIELEKIQEMLRLENERIEQENRRRIKMTKDKKKAQKEKEEKEKAEKERIERENAERERIRKDERERIEKEMKEKEEAEKERIRLENIEKQKLENERLEKERQERERFELEKQRLEKEMQEQILKQKLENERLIKELERQREREKEKAEREKELQLEKERQLKLEQEKREKELEEKELQLKLEKERMNEELKQKEIKKQKKKKLEQERLAQELVAKEKEEEEEKQRQIKLEEERLEQLKEKQRQIKLEEERLEQLKEKQRQIKLEEERLEKERKLQQERAEQEKIEKQKRLEQERLEQERIEKQKRLEQERLEQERFEKQKLEQERLEKERYEQAKLEKEKKEKERLEKEREEKIKQRLKYNLQAAEENKTSAEYKTKLLPKIRKEERKAEKMYKTLYNYQNEIRVEEKIDKIKENIPNIKSKYEILLEKNKNNNNNFLENKINEEEKKEDKPVNDWWGDIFK